MSVRCSSVEVIINPSDTETSAPEGNCSIWHHDSTERPAQPRAQDTTHCIKLQKSHAKVQGSFILTLLYSVHLTYQMHLSANHSRHQTQHQNLCEENILQFCSQGM
jgi:hypothetical protein